ncbi:MAG: DUF2007 domain-containing protein [Saprospiraceae bacterium]|nr:DUF2007 domain-containing protein [Saprospiraceae bacterium]MDW8484562.1 DUF2007 domain-containing protein [Saprospiraceae bacterium]
MLQDDILDDLGWENHLEKEASEVLALFYSPLEAELAAARLRAEGIPCFLASRTAQAVMPHLQLLVRLHVRPQDLQHARRVLAEAGIEVEEPRESKADGWLSVALFALLGVLLAALLVLAVAK